MAPVLSSSSVNPNPDVTTLSSSDDAPAPRLPSAKSGAATSKADVITLSNNDAPAPVSKANVITLSSSDDVITLSSSSDDEQEASSWKGSSSAGSKDGPAVLTSSDSDDSDAELILAKRRKIRPPLNVAWVFSDEVKILTALADERLESGRLPSSRSALDTIRRRRVDLQRENPTARDVAKKVHSLKDRFKKAIAAGGPSDERRDRELYHLSSKVWPDELLPLTVHNSSSSSSSG